MSTAATSAGAFGSAQPAVVPVHPEAVPDEPSALRWIVPAATLAFVGEVRDVPEPLQSLLDDGTVVALVSEPAAVLVRLGAGHGWREQGLRVRSALQRALADPAGWRPSATGSTDDILAIAVAQVLAGTVGDYIRSHGGTISVVAVHDDEVEVELSGSCSHCPAAEFTLAGRFETEVRELHPALRQVRSRDAPSTGSRRPLGLLPRRRL